MLAARVDERAELPPREAPQPAQREGVLPGDTMHAAMTTRTRAALLLGLLALPLLAASAAGGREQLVESLAGQKKFAPMWPGGTFEHGSESGLAWTRVVTDGKGGPTFAANVRPYRPLIDATGKFVKVWIKVDDASNLGGMEFRLSSDRFASSYFAFPISMYDDADFNLLRGGVWTPLTFSFGAARIEGDPRREAINSIGWYVADKGNETPVTAWWGGLALVDEPSEGVLSITFDDGYDEHLEAAEMMAKHRFPGTAYVIPDAVGQEGYLTLHQLVDLQERYGWDVAAHHQTPFTQMRPDELETAILGIQRFLAENEFGAGALHLAYPLGKQNTSLVRPLVRKHFTTGRSAADGPETLPPADPHLLRVLNVTNTTKPEAVGEAARRAKQNKEWLILMLHYLTEEPTNALEYAYADFERMLAAIDATGIKVMPLSQVWAACQSEACRLGPATAPAAAAD